MNTVNKGYLTQEDILSGIAEFACSQGLYGRLLRDLKELEKEDPARYDAVMTEIENQHFTTFLDFILWFEG